MKTSSLNPMLRDDVDICQQTDDRYVVHHQGSNRYYQLGPQGIELLRLFDGEHSYEAISKQLAGGGGANLAGKEVQTIAETQFRKFLVFPQATGIENEQLQAVTPSYLKLSKIILSPRTVQRISKYTKVFFRPSIMATVIVAFIVLISMAFTMYWGSLQFYFDSAPIQNITLFILSMIAATLFHEYGHASACEYYGVMHGGIGVGFYLLSPVMFADVTAAWKLPSAKRIVINFAGMYFEILLSVCLLITLFITQDPLFLGLTLVILFHLLFNLNPFFRTDGYWILSDYFELPNLRRQSTSLLRKAYLSSSRATFKLRDWLLVGYATFSYLFIGLFLYFILFIYKGSLLNIDDAVRGLILDVQEGVPVTVPRLFDALQTLIVPIFFYYLLFKVVIAPLYGRLTRPSGTAGSSPSFVWLLFICLGASSCGNVEMTFLSEATSTYTVDENVHGTSIAFTTLNILEIHDSVEAAGTPMLIYFSAKWCKPCRLMDSGTLSDERVVDCLMENYFPLKVDIDTPEGKCLQARYQVSQLPTYVFRGETHRPEQRVVGAVSTNRILNMCTS